MTKKDLGRGCQPIELAVGEAAEFRLPIALPGGKERRVVEKRRELIRSPPGLPAGRPEDGVHRPNPAPEQQPQQTSDDHEDPAGYESYAHHGAHGAQDVTLFVP